MELLFICFRTSSTTRSKSPLQPTINQSCNDKGTVLKITRKKGRVTIAICVTKIPTNANASQRLEKGERENKERSKERQLRAVTHWQQVNVTKVIVRASSRLTGKYHANTAHETPAAKNPL